MTWKYCSRRVVAYSLDSLYYHIERITHIITNFSCASTRTEIMERVIRGDRPNRDLKYAISMIRHQCPMRLISRVPW